MILQQRLYSRLALPYINYRSNNRLFYSRARITMVCPSSRVISALASQTNYPVLLVLYPRSCVILARRRRDSKHLDDGKCRILVRAGLRQQECLFLRYCQDFGIWFQERRGRWPKDTVDPRNSVNIALNLEEHSLQGPSESLFERKNLVDSDDHLERIEEMPLASPGAIHSAEARARRVPGDCILACILW